MSPSPSLSFCLSFRSDFNGSAGDEGGDDKEDVIAAECSSESESKWSTCASITF